MAKAKYDATIATMITQLANTSGLLVTMLGHESGRQAELAERIHQQANELAELVGQANKPIKYTGGSDG